jgi:hypothetical protein
MKRTKKPTVDSVTEEATKLTKETAQAVKDFIDKIPLKFKRPARVRVPHTVDGGIDWSKFLTNGKVLTERPEGMPYHIYKQLLFEQKWKLKMRKR